MNESSTAKTAKRYSEEIKTQVLGECDTAGAVIKAIAQKHGIPISLVHKWRYKEKCRAKTQTGCKKTETDTTGWTYPGLNGRLPAFIAIADH